ncbi:GFA family protein [soil metagenome]
MMEAAVGETYFEGAGLEGASLEGGCACGAVRYRVAGAPIFVNNCHCTLCQRQSGAGSAVNAFYESDRVTLLSGELVSHSVPTGSGKPQEIIRCATCMAAVWSHYPRMGRFGMGVRVGTLDYPGAVTPDAAIFLSTKLPWVTVPDGIPQFEATYDAKTLLPPERLERLMVLAAKARAATATWEASA